MGAMPRNTFMRKNADDFLFNVETADNFNRTNASIAQAVACAHAAPKFIHTAQLWQVVQHCAYCTVSMTSV